MLLDLYKKLLSVKQMLKIPNEYRITFFQLIRASTTKEVTE